MQKKPREIKSSGKTDQAPYGSKYKHWELPSVKWIPLLVHKCKLTWISTDIIGIQDIRSFVTIILNY